MTEHPATRFARNGDVHLAYQVIGDGPIDLLLVDDWIHHVEVVWEVAEFAHLLRRLGSFSRLIHFDWRGTGLSDPVPIDALPDLGTQVDDALAVLDAAGSDRPAILGIRGGGTLAMMLAATRPERCRALILYAAPAMGMQTDETMRRSDEDVEWVLDFLVKDAEAGGGRAFAVMAPSHADDARFKGQYGRLSRAAVRPGTVGPFFRQSFHTDVREVLPVISAPTLVLHRTGDPIMPVELGRKVASLINGATLTELPGVDHLAYAGDVDALVDEVEEFLTGTRTGADPERVLATLVFTDLVDSTRIAAEVGDRRWHDLLEEHRSIVRRDIGRFKGTEVDTTGDGFLAAFDGPGRAVRCALAIVDDVAAEDLQVRVGVHAGEVDVHGTDMRGLTVHIASRVSALASGGEVLVSSTVRDLIIGSGIEFDDRGEHTLKGVPGTWRVFAVRRPEARQATSGAHGPVTGRV